MKDEQGGSMWTTDPIQRCPICEGCGTVPCDFYARLGLATSTNRELCRTCEGGGILWTASGRPARPQEWGKTAVAAT